MTDPAPAQPGPDTPPAPPPEISQASRLLAGYRETFVKKCRICGKTFETTSRSAKYDSDRCRQAGWRRKMEAGSANLVDYRRLRWAGESAVWRDDDQPGKYFIEVVAGGGSK